MATFSPENMEREKQPGEALPLTDLALARAIAQAVCDIPGVAEMSPGLSAMQATYGPGGHINGVVLHHLPGELIVDVHVVAYSELPVAFRHAEARETMAEQTPSLLALGQQIRERAARTIAQLGLSTLLTVNVALDDIR